MPAHSPYAPSSSDEPVWNTLPNSDVHTSSREKAIEYIEEKA